MKWHVLVDLCSVLHKRINSVIRLKHFIQRLYKSKPIAAPTVNVVNPLYRLDMIVQEIVLLSGYEDIKAVHSSDHAEARKVLDPDQRDSMNSQCFSTISRLVIYIILKSKKN